MRGALLAAVAVVAVAAAPAHARPEPAGPVLVAVAHDRAAAVKPFLEARGARLLSAELGVWRVAPDVATELRERGALRVATTDRSAQPLGHISAGDPLVADSWWLAAIGATAVEPPGPGKPVTIIDAGLDMRHEEFAGRPATTALNNQNVFESEDDWHGTAVSSLTAAPANGVGLVGVYPQARLQVWDDHGTTLGGIVEGLDAASRTGGVINLSLGFTMPDPLLDAAVQLAVKRGAIVVAAAGNSRGQGNRTVFPAALPHVLTVAATGRLGGVTLFSTPSRATDVAAPGEDVPAAIPTAFTNTGYTFVDGTSFAAPIVAGAAAWVWTARPTLDQSQLFDLLRVTARDVPPAGFDHDSGFGVIDIPRALAASAPARDPQEPNEDVALVKPGALFASGTPALTTPSRARTSMRARLDVTEDPRDVYRVWVPRGREIQVRVTPTANVNVHVWSSLTRTVRRPRAGELLASGTRTGTQAEVVRVRNTRAGAYFYVETFLPSASSTAAYTLSVTTRR